MIYQEFKGIKDFCVCRGRDVSGHKDSYYERFIMSQCPLNSKPKCTDKEGLGPEK